MRSDELREKYLAYFESKGHVRRPSDVLVPHWDPSVLFTPAGMNQFKDHFLGKVKLEFTRATTCQKCLRTGDIENVGRTAYHHTFFEMLGNFSFGDYFKRDAIQWAWEFLTSKKWLGLEPAQLSATIYTDDDEAADIWHEDVGLPTSRIDRCGEDENFWPAMAPSEGPDGVCGPCSEIYYHTDDGRKVEIWNLVFTQFNRVGEPPDNLRPLPSKNIDTGMGLERTAAALQGVTSNYHIDTFLPLVNAAAEVCGIAYDPDEESGRRIRRIADHVRACTFAVHENVYPGPNKEKYVVKRLLRRAVLDGHQLGVRDPFLYQLVDCVAEIMRHGYPELSETTDRVAGVIQREEGHFLATVDAGLDRIESLFDEMQKKSIGTVSGVEAADMYATHGFPPELFETLAAEKGFLFDWDGFRRAMKKHGEDSGGGQRVELFQSGPLDAVKQKMTGTEFLGYERTETDSAQIVAIIFENELRKEFDEVGADATAVVVLDRSPFYGEAGGQMGDRGVIEAGDMRFEVTDTQRDGAFILHQGTLVSGEMKHGQTVTARVDQAIRHAVQRAHSATHLLHYALQRSLGGHAQQQGSKVEADWLRFDFSHPESVDRESLTAIEDDANHRIAEAAAISWSQMPLAEARRSGAMMLFGEKYPDIVRVVSMGDFSKELCGGTHLDNTAKVGLFKIVSEESVAAGTRRITAVTGPAALRRVNETEAVLSETAALLKIPAAQVAERVAALLSENRELRKKSGSRSGSAVSIDGLLDSAIDVGDARIVVAEVPDSNPQQMRSQIDQLRKKVAPVAVLLGTCRDDKVTLVAGISRDLQEKGINAADWIREPASTVGGNGGGKADMAQAGGKLPDQLSAALESARGAMKTLLAGQSG